MKALPVQLVLPFSPIVTDIAILVVMAAVTCPLGVWMYIRGIEKARKLGTLTRWQ